jgi:hypothetical protein
MATVSRASRAKFIGLTKYFKAFEVTFGKKFKTLNALIKLFDG